MPTLEELLKANDQSLSSFLDQDSEKEIVSDALAAPVRPEYLQFIEKYGRKPNQKKELPSFYEPKQSAPLVDAAASFFSNPPTEPLKSLPLPPGGGIGLKGEILAGDIEPEPKTTNPGRIPSSSLRSGMERQRSTPMYDVNTEDEVIKAAMQQPKSVDYLRALEKEKQLRDEKINELKNKKYSTREHSYASVTDEDRAKELDAYDSRSLQERAEERFAKEKAQKEKLNEEISNLNNELGYTTNIFKKETLEQELKNKQSELAKLSGDAEMGVEPLVRLPSSEIPSSVDEILSELENPSFKAEPSKLVSSGATQKSVLKDEIKKTTTGAGQPTAAEVVKQDREEELTKALGSQAAREIAQYEDLMNRFRQAQEKERNARLLAGLAQGSEIIGSALARAKTPDSKYWESFVEQAGLEKQQIKEKQDFEQEAQMRDPNSPISKEYQSLAKAMGISVSGKEPASVLLKAMPYLQQYQSQKENREARIQQAQLQREMIAATREAAGLAKKQENTEKEALRLAENKEYKEQESALSEMEFAENKIREITNDPSFSFETFNKKTYKKDLPGFSVPGLGRVTALSSEARELNTRFQSVLNQAIRAFAGKAVTKNELERIKAQYEAGSFANEKDYLQAFADVKKSIKKGMSDTEKSYSPGAREVLKERGKRLVSEELESPRFVQQKNPKIKAAAEQAGMTYEQMEQYLKDTGQIK